jgi:phosphoribosylformimino-5-aminoimidazole carboxamide ribotide isomerase
MRFRPCIDLHGGAVVQIVGATLREGAAPVTNFTAAGGAGEYARMFARDGLAGGHVIMLGPGNADAARDALQGFPGGLQIGGGIDAGSAPGWLALGAQRVIATSYVFEGARLSRPRLERLAGAVGAERVVLDLSCRRLEGRYVVMSNRWQTQTDLVIEADALRALAQYCAEFLIHAVDVEGLQRGPDPELIALLGAIAPIPTTYAGGIRSLDDVAQIERLGAGRLDFTVGSALDLFGGSGLRYRDLLRFGEAPSASGAP